MPFAPIATEHPITTSRPVGRLKRRAEFLHVGKGRRWHGTAMTVQVAARTGSGGVDGSRFGFTLTKKVGNAVIRNRIRRRLREAVRLAADHLPLEPDHDYVIVGRLDAIRLPFAMLQQELERGIRSAQEAGRSRGGRRGRGTDDNAPAGRATPERIRPRP